MVVISVFFSVGTWQFYDDQECHKDATNNVATGCSMSLERSFDVMPDFVHVTHFTARNIGVIIDSSVTNFICRNVFFSVNGSKTK